MMAMKVTIAPRNESHNRRNARWTTELTLTPMSEQLWESPFHRTRPETGHPLSSAKTGEKNHSWPRPQGHLVNGLLIRLDAVVVGKGGRHQPQRHSDFPSPAFPD